MHICNDTRRRVGCLAREYCEEGDGLVAVKQLKKQLIASILSVAVAFVALASSTYAWYVSNNTVDATTSTIAAKTDNFVLILENFRKMQVAADYLLSLINDILQMSKIEDGNVPLTQEIINFEELSQDVLTIIEQRAKDRGIQMQFHAKKRRASISFYLWKSGTFKTDIS